MLCMSSSSKWTLHLDSALPVHVVILQSEPATHSVQSYFEFWVCFESLVSTLHSLCRKIDHFENGFHSKLYPHFLFSVLLPYAVSIGQSVHRVVILKMGLIGIFLLISLYPFTWILPSTIRWVFFIHFQFTKHLPRYACSSWLLVGCMRKQLKLPPSQVAYKMGMLSKAGYSLVGVGRLPFSSFYQEHQRQLFCYLFHPFLSWVVHSWQPGLSSFGIPFSCLSDNCLSLEVILLKSWFINKIKN